MAAHSHQHGHAPETSSETDQATQGAATGQSRQDRYGNAHLAGQMDHGHSHAEEPAPAEAAAGIDLDVERPVGGAVPSEVREALYTDLRGSARAAWLLDEIESTRGDLDFSLTWSDKGTFHRGGKVYLRRTSDPTTWFASMAHELVHLLTYVSGDAADVRAMDRDTFVSTKMADEINGQALSYVATLQTGRDKGGAYFSKFYAHLQDQHPEMLVSEADEEADQANWAAIEDIAREWLEDQYKNHLVTNNTKENYYEYWGNYWDRVNGG